MSPNSPERFAAGESQTLEFKATFEKSSIAALVACASLQGKNIR